MASFAPPSPIRRLLQKSLEGAPLLENPRVAVPRTPRRLNRPETCLPVDPKEIADFFAPGGKLGAAMEGFAPRESQTRMAAGVAGALNNGSFLVAEAGTGTGKSLAYLVPAALYAMHNNWRVVVSTRTRNLQDQLVSKDLPLVAKALGGGLLFAALKGRNNYLCRQRFERLMAGTLGNLSWHERLGVLPLDLRLGLQVLLGALEVVVRVGVGARLDLLGDRHLVDVLLLAELLVRRAEGDLPGAVRGRDRARLARAGVRRPEDAACGASL
jgi:hypothetical protein